MTFVTEWTLEKSLDEKSDHNVSRSTQTEIVLLACIATVRDGCKFNHEILEEMKHLPTCYGGTVQNKYTKTDNWDTAHDLCTWEALFFTHVWSKGIQLQRSAKSCPAVNSSALWEIYGSKRVLTCTRQHLRRSLNMLQVADISLRGTHMSIYSRLTHVHVR